MPRKTKFSHVCWWYQFISSRHKRRWPFFLIFFLNCELIAFKATVVCILMFEFQTWHFFGRSGPCFYHLLFLPNFAWACGMQHYCRAMTAGNEESQAKRKWSSSYRRYLNNHLNKSIMVSIWLYWRDIIILNGET